MGFKLPKLLQRAFGLDSIPTTVFVTGSNATDVIPAWDNFEYSDQIPPLLAPTQGLAIESMLESIVEGYYGEQNFIQLFYCLPEIFAPVHEIAKRVASANWQLRKIRKTGALHDDEVIYNDKDFNRLFTKPNPLMSFNDFIYQSVCYELLTGKCFIAANRPSTLPNEYRSILSLWNLPAHEVCVNMKPNVDIYTATDINDLVINYTIPENGRVRAFEPDKVLPLTTLSLQYGNNLKRTRSPLCGAKAAIKNLIPVYSARGNIYIQQGPLGAWVSNKEDEAGRIPLTPTEKMEFLRDLNAHSGVTRGKVPQTVTNQPVQYISTGDSISELLPFDETLADAVAIYATLRVPRHLVPSKDHSTFSNANADMKSFYSDTVIPMANRYAENFTNFMNLAPERKYIYADYSHLDILQENKKEKAEVDKINTATAIQQFTYGVKTLNDILTAQGADENPNQIYSKYIFDMNEAELTVVKNALNLKTVQADTTATEATTENK